MSRPFAREERGSALLGVFLLLVLLMTLVPFMVASVHQNSRSSVKDSRTTVAFQLADSAVERAVLMLSRSSATWADVQAGSTIAGYNFDVSYSDIEGGEYAIQVSSGTGAHEVVIIGVGRDRSGKEVRAVKAVYGNSHLSEMALQADGGIAITGSNYKIHWGGVASRQAIVMDGRLYPQFWSAGGIDSDANGPTPPNCDGPDCCQWHSWSSDTPAAPEIDIDAYRLEAQAAGTSSDPQCGSYYSPGNKTLQGCADTSGSAFFVEGDLTVNSTGGGNHIVGDLIVLGSVYMSNGNLGTGNATVNLPQKAWRHYCRDWSLYRTKFDPFAPVQFPGLSSDYLSDASLVYDVGNKVFIEGFWYVGESVTQSGGGGSASIVGAVYVDGTVTLDANSNITVYHLPTIAADIKLNGVTLARQDWRELVRPYPAGL